MKHSNNATLGTLSVWFFMLFNLGAETRHTHTQPNTNTQIQDTILQHNIEFGRENKKKEQETNT